ncbi:META domain-containing protein [Endozoicomonas sp. Mp262]|uniref:META domain-containing protein n=1 Tax=Endozoicomonas sp. Mp262 TaxID=2919499 RepID=UPI0021DB7998
MKRLLVQAAIVATAGSLMVGCGTSQHVVKPEAVKDKTWVLTAMNGMVPVDSTRVTMEFKTVSPDQGRISGQGPCNRYFGGYKLDGKSLAFTPMGSTMMACPTPIMQEEKDYLATFEKINQMTMNKNRLELKDRDGKYTLTYGLETGSIKGRVESTSGGFPADSQVIVRLQDVSLADSRPAIIGVETIKLKDAVLGSVPFTISYAPELVKPERTYAIYVQVTNRGKVIYTSTTRNKVNLVDQSAKAQHKSAKG